MIFSDIPPCPALRPFVRYFGLVNLYFEPDKFPVTPYPARLEQALVFFARGHIRCHDSMTGTVTRIAPAALFGQQISRLNFECVVTTDYLMLMIVFQPGGMHRLLGIPAHELTGGFWDAESLLGPELRAVNDQIANAMDYPTMIQRAEAYILGKLDKLKVETHPIDRIGQLLLTSPTPFSLDWLACQANLSPRQFERRFSQRMGVGPKLYSRISRFYQTLRYKETHPESDWLDVALQAGYTDYNHLAKDFRQFAHVTPSLLLTERTQRPELLVAL